MPGLLFRRNHFPLDRLLVIWPPTCRTQTVHVVLDIVEAELTDLDNVCQKHTPSRAVAVDTYLISTRTWSEVPIGQVELFDAKRTEKKTR
jgi:hypothetical protein